MLSDWSSEPVIINFTANQLLSPSDCWGTLRPDSGESHPASHPVISLLTYLLKQPTNSQQGAVGWQLARRNSCKLFDVLCVSFCSQGPPVYLFSWWWSFVRIIETVSLSPVCTSIAIGHEIDIPTESRRGWAINLPLLSIKVRKSLVSTIRLHCVIIIIIIICSKANITLPLATCGYL